MTLGGFWLSSLLLLLQLTWKAFICWKSLLFPSGVYSWKPARRATQLEKMSLVKRSYAEHFPPCSLRGTSSFPVADYQVWPEFLLVSPGFTVLQPWERMLSAINRKFYPLSLSSKNSYCRFLTPDSQNHSKGKQGFGSVPAVKLCCLSLLPLHPCEIEI